MKIGTLVVGILLGSCTFALAQSVGGASGGGSSAGASSAGTSTGNSTGSTGSTLSNGSTISGTGGGPGANTSNALNHGTTGNSLGATTTAPTAAQGAASTGNAVNTPAANQAEQKLSTPDTGILRSERCVFRACVQPATTGYTLRSDLLQLCPRSPIRIEVVQEGDQRFLLKGYSDGTEERTPIVKLPKKPPRYRYRRVSLDKSSKKGG